jgi:hypothetical protein
MKKIILLLIIFSTCSFSQSAGNTGLSFLKFGFGARNIAMGDAGAVSADDITALFYNPSRLAGKDNSEIMFMHNEWIQDVRSEVLGVGSEIWGLPLALGFNVTTVNDIEIRTKPGEPDSKFNANYFFGSLSSGFGIVENIDFGISLKYLYEGILSDEATGWGVDLGLNYQTPAEGLTASAVIKNLGSMNNLRNEATKLPSEIRIGPAYHFELSESKIGITTAAEFQKYLSTDDIHFNLGAEGVYDKIVALRAGYQSGYESRGFTGGIGIIWGNLKFDYAFLPFSLGLGSASVFSLQFVF